MDVLESFAPDALEDDPELSAITAFAAKLTGMPIAQVTLVEEERQRFLAGEGLDVKETPRDVSFCDHAMRSNRLMEVRDATKDERFANNGLVTTPPRIRYYAGQPLISEEGAPLGALCVIDAKPHAEGLNDFQREGLAVLGQAVMRRLQFRRDTLQARKQIDEREERMRRIIEGLPQIAWSADATGRFDYFNAHWRETVGDTPPATADDWREFIHPDDWQEAYDEWGRCFASGEEYGAEYRLKLADGSYAWMLALAVPVAERANEPARWFGTVTDIDETRRALEERDLLAHELSHRIKNLFAVVIGLASLKARRQPEVQSFVTELTDTLRALGRAHEFVRVGHAASSHEDLYGLLEALFEPYAREADEHRVRVSGDHVPVSAASATPLALVFHELATNSAKYGALSTDDGHVTLVVSDEGDMVRLRWQEHGGPPVSEAGAEGFGSRLVEMSVKGQLGGTWERTFAPEGLVVDLMVSKAAIAR
ncbi:hypothetical protein AAW00_07800 [Aurantiacibacter luteus]|uniref:histidine kinase n=1 Tax=Aurantiacibacter luteus TaxID=1581420 RepID=A0A0G9MVU3_9SPHN|nr:hypothetical protein AAW00_07800 [Aurantiacibacter luteus]